MPKTKVVFFKEDDGSVPILECKKGKRGLRMQSRFCTGDIIGAKQTEFHNSRKPETRTNSLAKSMN